MYIQVLIHINQTLTETQCVLISLYFTANFYSRSAFNYHEVTLEYLFKRNNKFYFMTLEAAITSMMWRMLIVEGTPIQ